MSEYTDSISRPGRKLDTGTDNRQLYLREFGGLVLEAMDEVMNYDGLIFTKSISQGKSDTFPIIGRKRDATDHDPGEIILGGAIEGSETEVSLDKMIVDSVFIAEVDDLMLHFDIMGPYTKQLGQSIGTAIDKRRANMHILASRVTTPPYTGGPVPSYYWAADVKTNAAKLEEAAFAAAEYMLENDLSGMKPKIMLPHQQVLLLSRYTGTEGGPVTTGSGNRSEGTIGRIAGLAPPTGSNHIPKTVINTGLTKFQGDFSTTVGHISSSMAVAHLDRRGLKLVVVPKPDRLGTLIIASVFNGHGILRPECSFEIATTVRS